VVPDVEPIERQSPGPSPGLVHRYGIVAVLGVALLARVLYWVRMSPDYVPLSDAIHYDELAQNIANGMGYAHKFPQLEAHPTAFRPPLYPALLGGLYKVFGAHVVVGRVFSLVLGLGVVLLAYLLVLRIAGWRAAIVTGLLVAVYPPLLANDTFLLTEPLSLLLMLAMLLMLDRHRWVWAGAFCGLLVLSRPSAQFIVVVVAAWVLWQVGWKRALTFVGVTALLVVPWVLRNWIQVGEPVLVSSNGFNLAASYSPQAKESNTFVDPVFDERFAGYRLVMFNEAEWDQAMQDLAIQSLKDDPGQVFRVIGRNTEQYFELDPSLNVNPETSDGRNLAFRDRTLWTFYVVTLVGLFGLVVRVRQPTVLLVLAIAAYFTVSSLVLVAPPRVRAPFDLCCCIGVGLAVDWVWRRIEARRRSTADEVAAATLSSGGGSPA